MTWLLDCNVLVALRMESHLHHNRAHRWFATLKQDRFATCVLTQGTLLRVHMKTATDTSAAAAWQAFRALPSDFLDLSRHATGSKYGRLL